ncbi:cation-independent mannose-6-phosphate receptor-like isoform X1 [Penaeus chinensis]|uniref:cation-independent mannose-6-phosphate receptor-like isoform X1 n=1 Tax=Penaeus chinensis TaxID=139456 RepID=UPI001FB6FD7D|nr:cation-independent mannose-6-phosphate receptor-like isoform X1 [Penaeus chinensis]
MWPITSLLLALALQGVCSETNSNETKEDFPCKVVDGDHVYDLRELASRDYWKYEETLHTGLFESRVMYMSFCHPLRNVPVVCEGENVGVCETKKDDTGSEVPLGSRGQVSATGPVVTEDGWLNYVFESGAKCNKSIHDTTYKTYVHLYCARDTSSETAVPMLMSSPGCERTFAWMTKAACPVKAEITTESCTVKFSNLDYILNLHTLHAEKYYNVSSSKAKYELNICGPVAGGHCGSDAATMCDVTDPSAPVVLGTLEGMDIKWENEALILSYKHQENSVKVMLFCKRTATSPVIDFVEVNNKEVVLSVKTAAVCPPDEAPECVIEDDKGNVYDLRSLRKEQGNWEVVDERDNHKDQLYHINVCGQVNEGRHYHCPPGVIGACQTSFDAMTAHNLGFLTSHPSVNEDGSLTITYTGGDQCQDGKHARSTRINLICNDIEYEPVLVDETSTCEYIFTWLTPAACPRHLKKGTNCLVEDPLYGNVYDLNPLRNQMKDYNVTDGEHDYLINICGPLVSKCKGEGQSGVCQIKGDEQFSGGMATSNITFNDGTLVMNYYGGTGSCAGNNTRSAQIIFLCDQNASGRDGPHFFHEDETCTYHFTWLTMHACPPFSVVDCSVVTENGTIYDLNELSSSTMNEEYSTSAGNKKFVLNVCRSVVHNKESRCPYNAGACVIDLKHKDKALNIGKVHSGPYIEDGNLKIKYSGGDPCGDSTQLSETIIQFNCDKEELYAYPQLVAQEGCKYIFEWNTPIACPMPLIDHTTSAPDTKGNCTAKNDFTGYIFDLNSLKKKMGYEIQDSGKIHLILNVCDEVDTKRCPDKGTGACSYTHDNHTDNVSAGKANANLQYHLGFLSLYYTGGQACGNGEQRSTLISFICGAEDAPDIPVLIHEDLDKCIYYINWYTDLACERRINCFVDTWEQRLDLTPLIRSTGNYEVSNPENPKQKFYLNVCRPLNHIIGLNCRPGSSACLSMSESEALSLGQPITTPQYIYSNEIQMIYSHGSKCLTNSAIGISSRIAFICDLDAGKGSPTYKNVTHDCQYLFEWPTALACENRQDVPDSGPVCQIQFNAAKTNVNLKPLNRPEGYSVKFEDKEYKINVCGAACGESGVCTSDGTSFGLSSKSDLNWDYDKLKLMYYGGDSCSDALSGQRTTIIYFSCNMSVGLGYPVPDPIMRDLECAAIFNWETNLTCIEAIYNMDDSSHNKPINSDPVIPDNESHEAAKPSAEEGNSDSPSADQQQTEPESAYSTVSAAISSVLIVTGIIFVIILVLFKSERGQQVVSSARRFFGMRGYSNITQSRMENSSLISPSSYARVYRVDESDDDLLNVVT